jgi:hypothetical protein
MQSASLKLGMIILTVSRAGVIKPWGMGILSVGERSGEGRGRQRKRKT